VQLVLTSICCTSAAADLHLCCIVCVAGWDEPHTPSSSTRGTPPGGWLLHRSSLASCRTVAGKQSSNTTACGAQGMKGLNLRPDEARFQQAPQPDMVSSQVMHMQTTHATCGHQTSMCWPRQPRRVLWVAALARLRRFDMIPSSSVTNAMHCLGTQGSNVHPYTSLQL
jgi:hypothetical protein